MTGAGAAMLLAILLPRLVLLSSRLVALEAGRGLAAIGGGRLGAGGRTALGADIEGEAVTGRLGGTDGTDGAAEGFAVGLVRLPRAVLEELTSKLLRVTEREPRAEAGGCDGAAEGAALEATSERLAAGLSDG